jgi:hypothetical protein
MRARRQLVRALAILTLCVGAHTSDAAARGAEAQLSFHPATPGESTTVALAFRTGSAAIRAPLASVELRLPAGLDLSSSNLGVATCNPASLGALGPGSCPPDSAIGRGSATVSVPFGTGSIAEQIVMEIFMAPAVAEHTTMVFYAHGEQPIISQLAFEGTLLGDAAPFGARLDTTIPPLAGLPAGPDATLTSMRAEIGPRGLTYYRRSHGSFVPYKPTGFGLPRSCPRGGFPFAAVLTFADGEREVATSQTPCPDHR